MSSPRKLRIAVMVNSTRLLRWQYRMLERIQQGHSAEVVLAIVRDGDFTVPETSNGSRLGQAIFYRYQRWDARKFSVRADPFALMPLEQLPGDIATLTVTPRTTAWSDYVPDADLETIRGHDIDVIVRLGWRIVRGDILTLARHGVWSYHHGDNRHNRGGPPSVWEMLGHDACTGLTLQVLNEELDNGPVLARSNTATDPVSMYRTKCKLYWRSVVLLPRMLDRLHAQGAERFYAAAQAHNEDPQFYSRTVLTEKRMSLEQTLRFVGGNLYRYVREALFQRRYEEKWVLYYRFGEALSTSLWQFDRIESPDDRYWADPHVIARDGRFYIYVEEYPYATQRGRIALLVLEADGTLSGPTTIIDTDYHLSYPYVFEHDGRLYMIPESIQSRRIELYECTGFPDQWQLATILIDDIEAVDTTLHHRDDRWWMYTTVRETEGGDTHDEVHLFSADDLFAGHWTPHVDNAVVSDVTGARCAGPLFEQDGHWYRPAQDCSLGYGYALSLKRIERLDDEGYAEREVTRILPQWNRRVRGVHTLCVVPGLTIVDAKTFIPKSRIGHH